MTERIRCGAPTERGFCERWVWPGHSCGFHEPPPIPADLLAPACTCDHPFPQHDDQGDLTCLWCGRRIGGCLGNNRATVQHPERRAA